MSTCINARHFDFGEGPEPGSDAQTQPSQVNKLRCDLNVI